MLSVTLRSHAAILDNETQFYDHTEAYFRRDANGQVPCTIVMFGRNMQQTRPWPFQASSATVTGAHHPIILCNPTVPCLTRLKQPISRIFQLFYHLAHSAVQPCSDKLLLIEWQGRELLAEVAIDDILEMQGKKTSIGAL